MSKDQKIVLGSIASILALIIAGVIYISLPISGDIPEDEIIENENSDDDDPEGREESAEGSAVEIKRGVISKESGSFTVEAGYPRFNSPASDSLREFVENRVSSFELEASRFAAQNPYPSTLEIDFEVTYVGDKYASFLFTEGTYTGGAHPNQEPIGKTYDIQSGKELTLPDIFVPGSGYLEAISGKTTEKFKEKFESGTFSPEGAEPKTVNFDVFTITDDSITFYFPLYQIAPYAAGIQEITIPFPDLTDYLRPEFIASFN